MRQFEEPASPPRLKLALKFAARGNWEAVGREAIAAMGGKRPADYRRWRELHRLTPGDRRRMLRAVASWKSPPRFSIVGDSAAAQGQIYTGYEIVSDPRAATGDFISFVHPADRLSEHALYRYAETIMIDPGLDVIYGDQDTVLDSGEHSFPFFKPDWSPEYFLAWPYIGDAVVYRRKLVEQVGGWRSSMQSAAGYDLMLRLWSIGAKIHHIPDVFYHCRPRPRGAAGYGPADGRRAVEDYFRANGIAAAVEPGIAPDVHRIRYALRGEPLVSIVIPSACRPVMFRDRPSWYVLECVSSIRRLSTYRNIEIIVLDNNDMSAELAAALEPLGIRKVPFCEAFNLTRKINLGVSQARGEQILLLNDDVEVITPGWIEAMLEFSQRPEIGAVGAMLLFPNDTQQHTGVVIQDGNPRHPFYGEPAEHPGYFHSSQVHRNWSAVTGACTMTRAEIFRAVGGYSERFPLSYNDVDYCLKVRELGKRVVCTPHARLYHHESVSRPLTKPQHVKGFKEYWGPRFPRDPYYNPNLGRHFRVRI